MDRFEILDRYKDEEDRLFVSKIIDKIRLAKTRNQIEYTDFLDMHQNKISKEILNIEKQENFIYYKSCEELEKTILIIFPEKYNEIFKYNRYDFSKIVSLIRIKLPNELKGLFTHKDYLSGVMKLGIKREKVGDILVFEDGADIIVFKEISEYILNNLKLLTRFSKSKIEELNIKDIRNPIIKKEEIKIIVQSLRLDNIVSELAKKSRNETNEIIEDGRVLVNYEKEYKNSKIINEKDVIVIRGKGKYEVELIEGKTKKDKIVVKIKHYI